MIKYYTVVFDNSTNESHNINLTHPDYWVAAESKRQAISKARKKSIYKGLPVYKVVRM